MPELPLPMHVQEQLVAALLAAHPLPWHIEYDWTTEVIDTKGNCVMKLMSGMDARAFITFAEAYAKEQVAVAAEVARILQENDAERP